MGSAVQYEVADSIARITLNRPERLNAFDEEVAHAWREATIAATTAADVGAIIIQANGPAFCAGGDVREMALQMESGRQLTELARVINDGLKALHHSSVPVVAAAHGTTVGGGLGVLLSSDYAVVAPESKIGCLYSKIGLTPDLSVSALLARAVGERRALQLMLQENLLSAQEAEAWGLVAEVVAVAAGEDAAAAVQRRALEIAQQWVAVPFAFGQAKRLVRSQPGRSFDAQLEEEALTIGRALDTPQARERVQAFGKRPQ